MIGYHKRPELHPASSGPFFFYMRMVTVVEERKKPLNESVALGWWPFLGIHQFVLVHEVAHCRCEFLRQDRFGDLPEFVGEHAVHHSGVGGDVAANLFAGEAVFADHQVGDGHAVLFDELFRTQGRVDVVGEETAEFIRDGTGCVWKEVFEVREFLFDRAHFQGVIAHRGFSFD